MMNGMPTMAPITVMVSTTPTIRKTRPRITATSRPVAATIPTTSFQMAQNEIPGDMLFISLCHFCLHRMFTYPVKEGCKYRSDCQSDLRQTTLSGVQMISVIWVLAGIAPGNVHLTGGQVNHHGIDGFLAIERVIDIHGVVADRV